MSVIFEFLSHLLKVFGSGTPLFSVNVDSGEKKSSSQK